MLTLNNIEVIYDGVILVLKGVSLNVREGGITTLLGANGAGKTTTLKAVSGLLRSERGDVTKGSIEFKTERIDRLPPHGVVRRGIVQVFEGRRVFEHLTTEENLIAGAHIQADRQRMAAGIERVYGYFPRLKERRSVQAGYLSGGEQQMLVIGRAPMADPLVVQHDVRVGHRRAADHEHLLLASGEIAGLDGAPFLQTREVAVDALDPGGHALPVRLDVSAGDQVFFGGQVFEDPTAFEHLHDAAPDHPVRGQPVDPLVLELDRALRDVAALGPEKARDRLERRRLAGAVGAEQRRDPALADVERHALEDEDHAVVDDLDVVEAQHVRAYFFVPLSLMCLATTS